MDKDAKVFIAGVNNLIGLGLKDYLEKKGFTKVLSEETDKVNLLRQEQVESLFKEIRPEYVFLAHYKSGGITANIKYPAEFIYENLQVQ
ncbi:MAG TPA: NAD-dependent epimerase/dehydratase family protein, partial [Candidatus Omnitrophota bacterium]|nr:NAD-dependent epimerase/dehydratase family protein [Candidatus Omnitrophota bacterium]